MAEATKPELYTGNSEDRWAEYLKGRPRVPPSFWNHIYDYHASNGGEFGTVNDIGAGPGQFSQVLAKRFDRVIVTEPSIGGLEVAREKLAIDENANKFQFSLSKFEEQVEVEDSSVDLIFAANTIGYMKPDGALANIVRQLKPGGTLAIALFGSMMLDDPNSRAALESIFDREIPKIREAMGPENFDNMMELSVEGFDGFPLPDKYFKPGTRRIRINAEDQDAYNPSPVVRQYIKGRPTLGVHDQVVYESSEEWRFDVDFDGIKDYLASFPWDESVLLRDFSQKIKDSSPDGRFKGRHPVKLILATRR